jgi:hypothetical protein
VKPSSFHVGLFVCWGFFFVVGFFIWSGLLVGWHNLMTVDRFLVWSMMRRGKGRGGDLNCGIQWMNGWMGLID